VNGKSLQDVENWDETPYVVGCIAVHCEGVRLIDNITYKRTDYDD
jgi:pantoate--beta-alanine ligase